MTFLQYQNSSCLLLVLRFLLWTKYLRKLKVKYILFFKKYMKKKLRNYRKWNFHSSVPSSSVKLTRISVKNAIHRIEKGETCSVPSSESGDCGFLWHFCIEIPYKVSSLHCSKLEKCEFLWLSHMWREQWISYRKWSLNSSKRGLRKSSITEIKLSLR